MYNKAKEEYHTQDISLFIMTHKLVSVAESEDGKIFPVFCIEGVSVIMNLYAENVAALNVCIQTGKTIIKRMTAYSDNMPKTNRGMPCGECRNMKLEDINSDDADEISSVKIDRRKSSNEKNLDFLTQVKNPYVFKVNGKLVRMSFAENEPTADECLTQCLENLYR